MFESCKDCDADSSEDTRVEQINPIDGNCDEDSTDNTTRVITKSGSENAYSQLYGYFQHLCSNIDILPEKEREEVINSLKNMFNTKAAGCKNNSIHELNSSSKGKSSTNYIQRSMASTNVVHIKKQRLISKQCF